MRKRNTKVSERQTISLERARELWSYDPDTGEIRWRIRPHPKAPKAMVGSVAGFIHNRLGKYRLIRVEGQVYYAQQIAWLLHHGEWPKSRIRSLNGDTLDHRIQNLEDCYLGDFDHSTQAGRIEYMKKYNRGKWATPHHRNKWLTKKYGMTLEQYTGLLTQQDFVCSICEQPETELRNGRIKSLAVDHNHTTGALRGLLCAACNKMIGWAKEDPNTLERAVQYLQRHETESLPHNVVALRARR